MNDTVYGANFHLKDDAVFGAMQSLSRICNISASAFVNDELFRHKSRRESVLGSQPTATGFAKGIGLGPPAAGCKPFSESKLPPGRVALMTVDSKQRLFFNVEEISNLL